FRRMSRSVMMPRSFGPSVTSRCRMRLLLISWRASTTSVSGPVVIGGAVISAFTFMIPLLPARLGSIRRRSHGTDLLHLGAVLLHHAAHLSHHARHTTHAAVHPAHALHARHLLLHALHLVLHL